MNDIKQKKAKIEGFINHADYKPMDKKDMALVLAVPAAALEVFNAVLDEMESEGSIVFTKKRGRIMSTAKAGLIMGRFAATSKGYGFVIREGDGADLYVSAGSTHTAMHGDTVMCRIVKASTPNDIAEITSIVERARKHFVGTFEHGERGGFVAPDDKRLGAQVHVPWKFINDAKDGEKVKVLIDKFNEDRPHEGRVVQVLGDPLDVGMDVLSLVVEHDIPYEFPENVMKQASAIPHTVQPHEIAGRQDFRHLPTVTIDGEDTKDIDDGISLERLENGGFRLYVHIADVSHYVEHDTPLWKEALKRATSVYLADRVIPMLPPSLSNGICSLNPNVDRLALTCIIDLDAAGQVMSSEICKSVIHSDHAVTYTTLADILENPGSIHRASYEGFSGIFHDMDALAALLRNKRLKKGALEFDFPECKITIDAEGKVVDISRYDRSMATSIIEEFMVCANEVVATEYFWMNMPFIYRVHEEPHKEKIEGLMVSLKAHGASLKKGGAHAKNLQSLLRRVEGTPQGAAIAKLVLKSLKQARYYPEALGHFGLATEYYSHFTSPIRRFPDLMIHSIISDTIAGKADESYVSRLSETLPDICRHSSENERRADDCAREVDKLKKCKYMEERIGQSFQGVISHTTPSGVFVELENTVEGMISMSSLTDDYYEYDEHRFSFKGRRHGRTLTLGDSVNITVKDVNIELRRIDFSLE